MPSFCNNDGIIDEMTEAEACDIKMNNNKKKKTQKMIKGKRKERKLLLASNKRIKLEDRLNGLPDDIIVSILSRLTLKEAVRTSVLSQRWKNLWTWTTGTLDFNYSDKPSSRYFFDDPPRPFEAYEKPPLVERSWFVAWMNYVISLHQGQTVDKFEISCNLLGRLKRTIINKWVKFVLRKRVKSLRLDFRGTYRYARGNYSLKKAFLSRCSLDSLTVLDLKNVDVTGKTISYILVKCRFLEELCVEKSSNLVELRVPGPLPQLKCLKIKYCTSLTCLEIHAINLKSFAYHGRLIPVTFEKAPRLIEASYGHCYATFITANMRRDFPSYASCLESLVLDMPGFGTYLNDCLPEFPVLEQLRQLDLCFHGIDVDSIINCVASLLEKCPILERLSLKTFPLGIVDPRLPKRKGLCLHNCIRVLELVNFGPWGGVQAEIACFMVSNLPSLQQVIVRVSEVDADDNILSDVVKNWSAREAYAFVDPLLKIMQERGEGKLKLPVVSSGIEAHTFSIIIEGGVNTATPPHN